METILLRYYSMELFFRCITGVMGVIIFIFCLFLLLRELCLTWREKKARQREEYQQQEKDDSDDMPVLLDPRDRRGYMLNHIEDGRLYVISTLFSKAPTIVCAKRYDAEEQRLYCYAYLLINGVSVYNLHVIDYRGIFKLRDFLGGKSLRIDFDRNPTLFIFEEEYISPYLTERDFNVFVQSLQKAGVECEIEKGEDNGLGSCKYRLKEKRTK